MDCSRDLLREVFDSSLRFSLLTVVRLCIFVPRNYGKETMDCGGAKCQRFPP